MAMLAVLTGSWLATADEAPREATIHASQLKPDQVIGRLGHPLGTILTIDGTILDGDSLRLKLYSGTTLLNVSRVNGQTLEKPVYREFGPYSTSLAIDVPPVGRQFKYVAYETGRFEGAPTGLFKYVPPMATTGYHFNTSLVLLRDESKSAKGGESQAAPASTPK
jgi:hypothetical protein